MLGVFWFTRSGSHFAWKNQAGAIKVQIIHSSAKSDQIAHGYAINAWINHGFTVDV
jgi:hypothetical protein